MSSMKGKPMRIFVSNKLVKAVEAVDSKEHREAGRPMLHATCLALAMLAVKAFLGIGYRRTVMIFEAQGYTTLPDFRTLQWKNSKMKKARISIAIDSNDLRGETRLIVWQHNGTQLMTRALDRNGWQKAIRSLGTDFIEMAL